jgi:hypothetical protein
MKEMKMKMKRKKRKAGLGKKNLEANEKKKD